MPAASEQTAVSFALDARTLIAVHARVAGGRPEVAGWASTVLPTGAYAGGVVEDPPRLAAAMQGLLKRLGARVRGCGMVLAPEHDSFRALRLPSAPPEERRRMVRGELEIAKAIPLQGGAFDFIWHTQEADAGGAEAFVWLTEPRCPASARLALRPTGMQLQLLEPITLGLLRTFVANSHSLPPAAYLCPSGKHSDLCVVAAGTVPHVRRIPWGTDDLFASAASPSADHGEEPRYYYFGEGAGGAPETPPPGPAPVGWSGEAPGREGGPVSIAPPPSPALSSPSRERSEAARFLAAEVTRSLAFYARGKPPEAVPVRLYVLGADAVVRSIVSGLDGTQTIPVVPGDLPAQVMLPRPLASAPGEIDETLLYAAVGTALGAAGAPLGVPVVDVSRQDRAAGPSRIPPATSMYIRAALALGLVASVAVGGASLYLVRRLDTEVEMLRDQNRALRVESDRRAQEIAVDQYVAKARRETEIPSGALLAQIARAYNVSLSITALQFGKDGKAIIDGRSLDSEAVQRFVSDLARSGVLRSPSLERVAEEADGRRSFRVTGTFPIGGVE
jgi:hypothetical protein